jgi:hypothetical protein
MGDSVKEVIVNRHSGILILRNVVFIVLPVLVCFAAVGTVGNKGLIA